jgi:hypothetical protein
MEGKSPAQWLATKELVKDDGEMVFEDGISRFCPKRVKILKSAVEGTYPRLFLLKAGGRARTDSTIVLSAARQINGLVRLGETLRAALNTVAACEAEWLAGWVPSDWFDRYAIRFEDTRLPKGKTTPRRRRSPKSPACSHPATAGAEQRLTFPGSLLRARPGLGVHDAEGLSA